MLFAFRWWALLVLIAGWGSTHVLLRESGVWKDRNTDEVQVAQRHADYSYRLAVDAPAAKEVRLFGLTEWVVDRFADRRRRLHDLQWKAMRLREQSVLKSLVVVGIANAHRLLAARRRGHRPAHRPRRARRLPPEPPIGTSAIAFGGLSWALDSSSARRGGRQADRGHGAAGALSVGSRSADGMPAQRGALPRT